MTVLLLLVIGTLLIALFNKGAQNSPPQNANQGWVDFIAGYARLAKTKSEKALLARMLADLARQGMPAPSQSTNSLQQTEKAATASAPATVYQVAQEIKPEAKQLDNATLLLYFGAFLFLAAAGLFVAFAGASGLVRVAVVFVAMAVLYLGGFWLIGNKPKLASAGKTFVGMGMMLAPLVGLAAYSYGLQGRPQLVWLLTSLLCFGLYYHALTRLKTPLLEYVFIGSFVSLFESGISVLHAPLYYYAWGLAATGLLVQAWALLQNKSLRLEESVGQSSNILVPLSAFGSLYLSAQNGYMPLAISLLLAALFYVLQAWRGEIAARPASAVAAQVALLSSVASGVYAWSHNLPDVGWTLMIAAVPQLAILLLQKPSGFLRRFTTVAAVSTAAAVWYAWSSPWLAVGALVAAAFFGYVAWWRLQSSPLYVYGLVATIAAMFTASGDAARPPWSIGWVLLITFAICALQICLFCIARHKGPDTQQWRNVWRWGLLATFWLLCMQSLDLPGQTNDKTGSLLIVLIAVAIAGACYWLQKQDGLQKTWLVASSLFVFWPVVVASQRQDWLLLALAISFAWNLALVLEQRLEISRIIGSISWFFLPAAVVQTIAPHNTPYWYAAAYLVATFGFIVARTIAQKRIASLPIALTELQARLHSDSLVYVVGYSAAAATSLVYALRASHKMAAVVMVVLAAIVYYLGKYLEKRPDLLLAVPLMMQGALWLTYEPGISSFALYIAVSSILALAVYAYLSVAKPDAASLPYQQQLVEGSLPALYVAPLTFASGQSLKIMPISLMVAGLVTLHAAWRLQQAAREAAGTVVVVGLVWLLWQLGIHNVQVYTHVFAALAGLYAYWRYGRGESSEGYSYLLLMLLTASVPLALQILAGQGGGLYGWWFIGEQIAIMLLGMAISNRLVIRWGLYASVAAVLYQLRVLPWLSLSLLAIFLIGLAVYQLQKQGDKK